MEMDDADLSSSNAADYHAFDYDLGRQSILLGGSNNLTISVDVSLRKSTFSRTKKSRQTPLFPTIF